MNNAIYNIIIILFKVHATGFVRHQDLQSSKTIYIISKRITKIKRNLSYSTFVIVVLFFKMSHLAPSERVARETENSYEDILKTGLHIVDNITVS